MNEKDTVVEVEEEVAPETEVVELTLEQLGNVGGGVAIILT